MSETEEDKIVQEEVIKKPRKSLGRRILKIFLYIILIIIGLNALLYLLLSIPAVQDKAKDFAVNTLKSKLKTEISIDELRLSLFNRVSLKGTYIEDQSQDTLIYAKELTANLDLWKLLNSELLITGISLDDFVINVNQKDSASNFNFQFIIDAFASSDTTEQDTTSSSLNIILKDIDIRNGRLSYNILSDSVTPGIFNSSHITINDLSANLDLNSIDSKKLDIAINHLAAKEQTGLTIKDLKGTILSDGDQLYVKGLSLELPDSHLRTSKAEYNLQTNKFEVETSETEISAVDLIPFLPNLKFLSKHKLVLNTHIKGALPMIDIENILVTYGEDFILSGQASMADSYNYGSSDINLSIDKFQLSPEALSSFVKLGDSTFIAPDILTDMGNIYMKGHLKGKLSNFNINAEAWAKHGGLNISAKGSTDTTFTNLNLKSDIQTKNFNLGSLLGKETGLGRLAAHMNLNVKQSTREPLSAQIKGAIDALQYEENNFKNIPVEAFYNVHKMGMSLNAKLKEGHLIANAEMSQAKIPDIHIDLKVDSLLIKNFYKEETWQNPKLSFAMNGDIKGLDIDNMSGHIEVSDFSLIDSTFSFKPGAFNLQMGKRDGTGNKFIDFTSSILKANIEGEYRFATLPDEISTLLHDYLANVFEKTKRVRTNHNDFSIYIESQNTEELGKIFNLPANIITPASIQGRINTIERRIDIEGSFPLVRFDDIDIKNTRINIANQDSAFNISTATKVFVQNNIYNLSLDVNGANNALQSIFSIKSDSADVKINGQMKALAQFEKAEKTKELLTLLQIEPSDIKVGKLDISLLPAKISYRENHAEVSNFGIALNKKRYFGADGIISSNPSDSLRVYFDHAQIADILEPFNIHNIKAAINGNLLLKNLMDKPELYTEGLKVSDIILFSDTLGTMSIESQWRNDLDGIRLKADLIKDNQTSADVNGFIYTTKDSLDLAVNLDKFALDWAQPFVSDMLNRLSGSISSKLTITGKTTAPSIQGWLGLNNASVGIDYTNVVYNISDTIQINPGKIGFDNLILRDSRNNTGTVSALVTHQNFEKMKYSLNLDMKNLMVLNTENRTDSLFFGQVFASGNVKLEGDENNINVNMNVRNDKNSNINILIPQTSEATDYQSVVFINVPEDKKDDSNVKSLASSIRAKREEVLPLKLGVTLNVTPDLGIGVIINQKDGTSMQVKGRGQQIKFNYDMATESMKAEGEYNVTEGNVRVNLQKISNLDFRIQEGSQLTFVGDPLKTRFNITAYRRVRADLKTLDNAFATDNTSSTKSTVHCILVITGDMDKMNISYDINLPEATDDIKQKVKSLIATDEQKIKQFAYLIAFGTFYSSTGSGGGIGGGMWTNLASSTLSEGLNSVFGSILGDSWEIGTNIESNDGTLNNLDMSVNVSKKFLDDKLKFNTNLGYRTDQTSTGNSLIGDFNVEYQLNPMWTLKAYNKTNDQYSRQAETTQGIGIVYTREARSLKSLFRFFGKNRRQRNIQQPPEKQPATIEEKRK